MRKTAAPKNSSNRHSQLSVYLDVDDCLIFDTPRAPGWKGADASFNMTLINELVSRGISEVTLVSSMKLNIPKTNSEREEMSWISRLALIEKLSQHGITVKRVVSNYDMANKPGTNEQYNPGEYYEQHIRPFEQLVSDFPNTDLNKNTRYTDQFSWQSELSLRDTFSLDALKLKQTQCNENKPNIKHALFDRIFVRLSEDERKKALIFIDDKACYITAASEMATKHGLRDMLLTHQISTEPKYEYAQGLQKEVLSKFFDRVSYLPVKGFVHDKSNLLTDSFSKEIHEGHHQSHAMTASVGDVSNKHYIPIELLKFDEKRHISVKKFVFLPNTTTLTDGSAAVSSVLLMVIDASTKNKAINELVSDLKPFRDMDLTLKIVAIGAEAQAFCDWVNTTSDNPMLATAEKIAAIKDGRFVKFSSGIYRDLAKTGIPAKNARGETLSTNGKTLAKLDISDLYTKLENQKSEQEQQATTVEQNIFNITASQTATDSQDDSLALAHAPTKSSNVNIPKIIQDACDSLGINGPLTSEDQLQEAWKIFALSTHPDHNLGNVKQCTEQFGRGLDARNLLKAYLKGEISEDYSASDATEHKTLLSNDGLPYFDGVSYTHKELEGAATYLESLIYQAISPFNYPRSDSEGKTIYQGNDIDRVILLLHSDSIYPYALAYPNKDGHTLLSSLIRYDQGHSTGGYDNIMCNIMQLVIRGGRGGLPPITHRDRDGNTAADYLGRRDRSHQTRYTQFVPALQTDILLREIHQLLRQATANPTKVNSQLLNKLNRNPLSDTNEPLDSVMNIAHKSAQEPPSSLVSFFKGEPDIVRVAFMENAEELAKLKEFNFSMDKAQVGRDENYDQQSVFTLRDGYDAKSLEPAIAALTSCRDALKSAITLSSNSQAASKTRAIEGPKMPAIAGPRR